MRKIVKIFLLLFLFVAVKLHITAQNNSDSLWAVWNDVNQPDVSRLNAFHKLIKKDYQYKKPDSALILAKKQFDFAKSKGIKSDMAASLTTQGIANSILGNNKKAIEYFQKSLKVDEERKNIKGVADSYNNIGVIYYYQTNYPKALEFYMKALKIREEINDYEGLAKSYNNVANIYDNTGQPEKALEHHHLSLALREEQGDEAGILTSKLNIALVYRKYSQYDKALELLNEVLQYREEQGESLGIARTLYNIGIVYQDQGIYTKAATYYIKCLKIYEELGSKKGIASSLSNLGVLYSIQEDYDLALSYFEKGLIIRKEIGDERGIAESISNIADLLVEKKDYQKALKMYGEGLIILEKIGYKGGIASLYISEAMVYKKQKKYEEAITRYNDAKVLFQEIKNDDDVSKTLKKLGDIYFLQNKYEKAKSVGLEALEMAQGLGSNYLIRDATLLLYKTYKALKDKSNALKMFELNVEVKDSIFAQENEKELIKQTYKFKYEKEAAADSVRAAEAQYISQVQILAQEAQIKQEQTQRFVLYGGLLVLLLFGGFMYNRFKKTQQQKQVIEQQKEEVETAHSELEEKNKEITDSIQYAKRIQNAILPPKKVVKEYLQESFILYKPKDIVAGDFYWMESPSPTFHKGRGVSPPLEELEGAAILFAVADCTGHGVPGAMVSVICNNGLNRCVREYGLTDPGDILDKTREIVVQEFEKSDEEVKDGMDIALCSLRFNVHDSMLKNNKESLNLKPETAALLEYAGANNPLWIIRPLHHSEKYHPEPSRRGDAESSNNEITGQASNDEFELIEIKANKQPIGKFDNPLPYTTHTLELQRGDSIYIFTDGYVDQFGGEKGKKFKSKAFKELLLSVQHKSMEEQRITIDKAFEVWKGDLEQLDDVCIIGVKI